MSLSLLELWGKARETATTDSSRYHPAICHMIDVGNVAQEFLERCGGRALRAHLLQPVGGEEGAGFLPFLVALHDLGKLTPPFQARRRDLCANAADHGAPLSTDHGAGSTYLVSELLRGRFGWARSPACAVGAAVGGHHGILRDRDASTWCARQQVGNDDWKRVREEAVDVLLDVFVRSDPPRLTKQVDAGWLMTLAGFTSVMDWVGSMEDPFAYEERVACLYDYARASAARARLALERLNWLGWRPTGATWGADLFSRALRISDPRPMQTSVMEGVARAAHGPKLILVEAPTGQGKTEAALAVSERLLHEEDLQGLYYGLPTQATSNQMFRRVAGFLERRYAAAGLDPELHLLHGNRLFHPQYRALPDGAPPPPSPSSILDVEEGLGSIRATEWFRGRKRGLLAHFAVGTVDQALLGVLRLRHQAVRLFGLSAKVVVLDEVHAYDAYMTRELERLCEWARATGSSVIMLSATLPRARRDAFVRAFGGEPDEGDGCYPALTVVDPGSVRTVPLPPPPRYRVTLEACSRELVEDAPEQLLAPVDADGSVAWICNTVDEAQRTFSRLRERLCGSEWEIVLFHARMPLRRRLEVEERSLRTFGKERPSSGKRLIVATQVIEQSLDLDFDLLISEVCPIDLLLQRIGRLHRHARADRPSQRCPPTLRWLQPRIDTAGLPEWSVNGRVYEPYALLTTWELLARRAELVLPDETRALIEAVYGEPTPISGPLGEALKRARQSFLERAEREVGTANFALVPPPDRFRIADMSTRADLEDDDVHPVTRLGDRGVRAALLFGDGSRVAFEPGGERSLDLSRPPSADMTQRIVLNAVTLSQRGERLLDGAEVPPAWRRTALLRATKLVRLDDQGRWSGARGGLRWDTELGVVYEPS